jgi:putative protease
MNSTLQSIQHQKYREKKQEKHVELLAPAKNFMALKASGPFADAVYFGVQTLNMRIKADNFQLADLPKIVRECHSPQNPLFRTRKVFLTVNILIYENELKELQQVIQAAKNAGVDAVIVHDFAAIQMAKKIGIPFHVSTQCNVSNSAAALFYEEIGAERVILARECSLAQIREISPSMTTASIETFVHGAMCSSISGRCYLSQTITGSNKQSANRGLCTQPCRGNWALTSQNGTEFIYDGERIFNSRDLCMINYIPELIEAGIISFKIEGRMRHPHYVETVTKVYREAIDAYYAGNFEKKKKTQRWITRLKQVYNRGFTTGFFFEKATIKDSQLYNPANVSHFRYIEMGHIIEYYPTGAVKIKLDNGTLKVGDNIIVMSSIAGPGHDTYFTQTVNDIQIQRVSVDQTPRGTKSKPIILTMKIAEKTHEKGIDRIYKFTEETYRAPITKNYKGQKGQKGPRKKRKSSYLLD